MANEYVTGTKELTAKLRELGSAKEQAATLRAAVREPMQDVMRVAQSNIGRISPGARQIHRTYKGRLVSAGFAARNLRLIVVMSKDKEAAWSLLGVRKEAFYALQFFELGTAKIPRQPWLMPAFYQSRNASLAKLGEVMKERIEKIARKRGGA